MLELQGKYNKAKVFTDNIEETAIGQIIDLCNQEIFKDSKIRIMSDVHAGAGCTIGTTMTISNKVIAAHVGVDIGCGMLTIKLSGKPNLELLDSIINEIIPSGFNSRKERHKNSNLINLEELKCYKGINIARAYESLGTLGGGNHFIEISKDSYENYYLIIHSGSRNIGLQVAQYYQNLSNYLEGDNFDHYLFDMDIIQRYADLNRFIMAKEILDNLKLKRISYFSTIHNYIDLENMILRKGAVSAQDGEELLIPMNMRDGSLLCIGKGNEDWNFSAPHGAGRIMSRSKAKKEISLEEYQKSMEGIATSSVNLSTIDEAPMAYKSMQEIIDNIQETVEVIDILKPIYNFKAGEK